GAVGVAGAAICTGRNPVRIGRKGAPGIGDRLAICLGCDRRPLPRWLALAAAQCLVAAIAWTGHAASTPSRLGYLHLTADALHLDAAAAWTGGLVALLLLKAVN